MSVSVAAGTGSSGWADVDTDGGYVFSTASGLVREFYVITEKSNTDLILVNIEGLHASGVFVPIPPGVLVPFQAIRGDASGRIGKVFVKSAAGTQKVGWGVKSG